MLTQLLLPSKNASGHLNRGFVMISTIHSELEAIRAFSRTKDDEKSKASLASDLSPQSLPFVG